MLVIRNSSRLEIMPHLIAYAWILTVVVTVAAAAYRGIPVLSAFGWINTHGGARLARIALALAAFLVVADWIRPKTILGQRPITWAMLEVLVYAWLCIGYNLTRERKQ